MIKIVDESFDHEMWNKVAPHPLQSWEWGEARGAMGIEVVRVGEFAGENLTNTFQFTIHNLPFGFKIGYLPRSKYPSTKVIDFLHTFGKKNNLIFIKIEPYERVSSQFTVHSSLQKSPHPLFPEWTIMVDLTKSEEELFKALKSKTRYNVRLAQKKGVQIKEMTNEQGFEIFAKLYFETTKRQKYFGHNYTYHASVFEALNERIAHILIAFYGEKPLAAYEVFIFNGLLYYTYGGSSEEERHLMAPNLLMWEAIKFGKASGATQFDMWNALPPNYDHRDPWAGFTRFKEGYGGSHVRLSSGYDLVIKPFLYRAYCVAHAARKMILGV